MPRSVRKILAVAPVLLGLWSITACTVDRHPMVLHEPQYSYLRDQPDSTPLSAADATQRLAKAPGDTSE